MKIYSYLVEGLADGQWSWTVFGDDHKPVRNGTAKGEHEAKVAALKAIDELMKLRRVPCQGLEGRQRQGERAWLDSVSRASSQWVTRGVDRL
jgi:hypothetical protein